MAESSLALTPVASSTRREGVMVEIRRAVTTGALRPGEKLTEFGLAGSLRVSRATIREALNQLAQEGLVVAEPYRGLRVADLSPSALRDLAHTRVALDLLAVTDILADETGGRLAAVETCWAHYATLARSPDPAVRHDAHVAFHRGIWTASQNFLLAQLWPVIEAHMTIALAQDQATRPDPDRSYFMHELLMDAIRSGDLDIVHTALVEHIVATTDELLDLTSIHITAERNPS
jgi:DNA-binding GntR family transcriptional regulator